MSGFKIKCDILQATREAVIPAAAVDDSKMMTVSVKVEKPDIIVVENMDDINTNAIMMHVCMDCIPYFILFWLNVCMTKSDFQGSTSVLDSILYSFLYFSLLYVLKLKPILLCDTLSPLSN